MLTFEIYKSIYNLIVPDIPDALVYDIFKKSQSLEDSAPQPLLLLAVESMIYTELEKESIRKSVVENYPNELLEILVPKIRSGNEIARRTLMKCFENEPIKHLKNHVDLFVDIIVEIVTLKLKKCEAPNSSIFFLRIRRRSFSVGCDKKDLIDIKTDREWSTEIPYQLARIAFQSKFQSIVFEFDGEGIIRGRRALEARLRAFTAAMNPRKVGRRWRSRTDQPSYETHPVSIHENTELFTLFSYRSVVMTELEFGVVD